MDKKKIEIKGSINLLAYLQEKFPKNIGVPKRGFGEKEQRVVRKTFRNYSFTGDFHNIEFKGVKFVDCEFDGIWGFLCVFQNCKFESCSFRNCRFSHLEEDWRFLEFTKCYFRNIELDEGSVYRLTFDSCTIMNLSMSGLVPSENIRFYNCEIEESYFAGLQDYNEKKVDRNLEFIDILFSECTIAATYFHSIDFRNSIFLDTILYKTGFFDCKFDNECLILTKELRYESYASMDFQTILKSEELSEKILSKYFNIKNKINLKVIISNMTTQKIFSTVFISYSFKDTAFAKKITESLNSRGIRTFLWENDAPGGRPLEEIMISGITSHDKLLFIASENSIRSKACQYELTTARKKQEASWENVFFPIFIDDYLFKVKKTQIRPIEFANEYWENIEEIKRINALDFSAYNNKVYEEEEFNSSFEKIVDGLKIAN